VLTHIFDYVHRHVELDGERVIASNRWQRRFELRAGEMYICPRSGLLKTVRLDKPRELPRRLSTGDERTQLHFRENWWWEVRVRKWTMALVKRWDVWLERPVGGFRAAHRLEAYGGDLFATSKRPLTREEVRVLHRKYRSSRRRQPTRIISLRCLAACPSLECQTVA
jgi:hypothetical protein